MSRCRLFATFWLGVFAPCLTFASPLTEPGVATIAFVGDIMLADTPGQFIARKKDPFAAFSAILDSADLRVGNLECVVAISGSPEPGKPFVLRAHPRVLPVLGRHVDAVSVANNHSGDYGPLAFEEMLGRLETNDIAYFGGGRTLTEAHRPKVVERNGLRIALLGYNEFFPRSFEAQPALAGIAWSEDEQVRLDIAAARKLGVDLVIPFMHWGWEHDTVSTARQRQLARFMIEAGADAVVGSHPHVVQEVELFQGKPIIYSLGNFVFDSYTDELHNTGWVLKMDVDRDGVQRAHILVAAISEAGVPTPKPVPAPCWERGQSAWSLCPAPTARQP